MRDLKYRESNTRSNVPILALPELEVLIHQRNDILAVGCLLAFLSQCRSIQSNKIKQYIRHARGPYNMLRRKPIYNPARRTIQYVRVVGT